METRWLFVEGKTNLEMLNLHPLIFELARRMRIAKYEQPIHVIKKQI